MFKGRPEALDEKALKDLQGLGDEQWESLLKGSCWNMSVWLRALNLLA